MCCRHGFECKAQQAVGTVPDGSDPAAGEAGCESAGESFGNTTAEAQRQIGGCQSDQRGNPLDGALAQSAGKGIARVGMIENAFGQGRVVPRPRRCKPGLNCRDIVADAPIQFRVHHRALVVTVAMAQPRPDEFATEPRARALVTDRKAPATGHADGAFPILPVDDTARADRHTGSGPTGKTADELGVTIGDDKAAKAFGQATLESRTPLHLQRAGQTHGEKIGFRNPLGKRVEASFDVPPGFAHTKGEARVAIDLDLRASLPVSR